MTLITSLFKSRNLIFRQLTLPINAVFKRYYKLLTDTDLHRGSITVKTDNPFDLFNEWYVQANKHMTRPLALAFILSNYSPERKVQSRLMIFAEQQDDKFTIFGSSNTHKIKDIQKYPDVSMCFHWPYPYDNYFVLRQIRVTGKATQISNDKMSKVFDKLNLPLRIEWSMSKQNEVVKDWRQKQEKFMELTKLTKTIAMPSYMTGFTIQAEEIQFLHTILKTKPFFLADRVLFKKAGSKWIHEHIGA